MKRIGIAASRISKGHLLKYNMAVIVISSMCGLFLFVLTAALTCFSVFFIVSLMKFLYPQTKQMGWVVLTQYSLLVIWGIISLLVLYAIIKNIRLRKPHS